MNAGLAVFQGTFAIGRESAMPSQSSANWLTTRTRALDEIAHAHRSVGGTARGRRYATRQINHAYVVLLAAQFQGFCRDLHSECVEHLIESLAPSGTVRPILRAEFTRGRQLERGNAQPGSIGADFGRFGFVFWDEVILQDADNVERRAMLETLNAWRNAIAHQDFQPSRLGGSIALRLAQVRRWRSACERLTISFDSVMHAQMINLTRTPPW